MNHLIYKMFFLYVIRIFVAVAADVIARCAFGMKIDSLNDPNSPFVKNLTILTQGGDDPNFMLTAVCKSVHVYDSNT